MKPLAEIDTIINQHQLNPAKRFAQSQLAQTVVFDLHGQQALDEAIEISNALFSGNVSSLNKTN